MRNARFALLLGWVGVSGCSLLLDTDRLQRNTPDGGTGTGGAGGSGGGSVSDGGVGKACQSDTDCLPGFDIDGCTLYACLDNTCQPPKPNSGALGVFSAGSAENVLSADDIGYPSLLADASDFVTAVWHRSGNTSDVLIRKYPASQGGVGAELSVIAKDMFRAYASSPGLIVRQLPRRVRLLLAAEPTGDAGPGVRMRQVDIDVVGNNLQLSNTQPAAFDLGVTGYDTRPRSFPPRLIPNGLREPGGMWMQQQKLYYFDGTTASEAFATKRVLGFAPLAGGGVQAALQTADFGGVGGLERTEIWFQGNQALVSLDGDQPAPRRGVTATFTNEGGLIANLIGWSFEPPKGAPSVNYTAALCGAASCASAALSSNQQTTIPTATFPELASSRVAGSTMDRDVLQTFEISVPDPSQSTNALTVLFGAASRFTFPSADLSKSTTRPMYPPLFPVDAASGPATLATGEMLGPSSVAVTGDGQMMVAWVVRSSPNQAHLKVRRYGVRMCP